MIFSFQKVGVTTRVINDMPPYVANILLSTIANREAFYPQAPAQNIDLTSR